MLRSNGVNLSLLPIVNHNNYLQGWGVRTKLPIKAGEFILEYVGEVVSDQEFKQRMASRYAYDTHHYCLHLDGGLVIDGHRMGGDGKLIIEEIRHLIQEKTPCQ